VPVSPPRFWQQQITWSYCATSQTFSLVAWRNSNEKVNFSCNQRAARSVVVMLQVWYAIPFQLDSPWWLPFSFFHFFKTFQSLCVSVRLRVSVKVSVRVSIKVSFRVTIRVGVMVIFRVSVKLGLQLGLGLGLIFCVYFDYAKPVAAGILVAK